MNRRGRFVLLLSAYLVLVLVATLAAHGRSLQEWVFWLTPPGTLRNLLMYPLQHHHPVTFAKLLNIGHFIGNILLFLPVGMGSYFLLRRRFPDSIRKLLLLALLIGFMLSSGIEFLQQFVPQRIPSLADVIENTGGAVFGCYLLYFRQRYRELNATTAKTPCVPQERDASKNTKE